jgi:serine/threonine-protein kinase PRP4
MASRDSSASEGEIAETTHKANTATSRHNKRAIDNSSRGFGLDGAYDYNGILPGRSCQCRLTRLDYTHHDRSRSPSPYRRRKGDRSPSPYRRNRDRSPSPYRRDRGSESKNPHSSKHKISPPPPARPEKRYQPDRGRPHGHGHSSHHDNPRNGTHRPYENGTRNGRDQDLRISNAENEHHTSVPRFQAELPTEPSLRRDNRNGKRPNNSMDRPRADGPNSNNHKTVRFDKTLPPPKGDTDVEMEDLTPNGPDYMPTLAPGDVAPSQETREEKKRRWAAKRAQLAAENTSLLQKALLTNASETTTPDVYSPAARSALSLTPPPESPRTPDFESMPASPSVPASPDVMIVDKQEARAERASPVADGPSAANYDPMQDMLDDRLRAEQKAKQPDMSASSCDETNPKVLSTLPAEKVRPAKKQKTDIDMFAFSDEEEEEQTGEQQPQETEQLAGLSKGTVLDEKLLDNWDDPEGYYKIISNELVNAGHYRMVKPLGRGVFANVAQAEDVKGAPGSLVAIKIVRRNDAMRKASSKEMDFLQRLNEADPQDKRHIIRYLGSFDHKGHLCIVFEHMSKNLRDLLKEETSGHGLSLQAVKTYARQMFSGLKHMADCQIVHADLKPDNILVSLDKKTIKLCDLGTAADKRDNQEPTPYLVSRFYRAPEIILGMEIGYAIDMWAIGCTLFELWTGKILFPGRSNNQMVKVFMECMGWPSEKLLKKGLLSGDHFEPGPPLKFFSHEVDQFDKVSALFPDNNISTNAEHA